MTDDPSTRETSDGTLLTVRQACDIADRWPGVGEFLALTDRVRAQNAEIARAAQRLARLRTVARMAEQALDDLPVHGCDSAGSPCDCTECILRAAVDQLEPGDLP